MGCLAMIEPGDGLTLLDRVEAFLLLHKMRPSAFGTYAVKTPSLVYRMRAGKRLRRTTIERIEVFLSAAVGWTPQPQRKTLTPGQYKARRYRKAIAENIRADMAERDRRLADPCEQAAIHLRRQRWVVTRAKVHDEKAEGWCVGTMRKTDEELLAMARRNGWRG